MQDIGSFLRIPEATRNNKAFAYHCLSSQTLRKDCTFFQGVTGLELGVITDSDLVLLDIPSSMLKAELVFGEYLDNPILDMTAFLSSLAEKSCRTDACKAIVKEFVNKPEHRALASRETSTGAAFRWNLDTPSLAVLGSIFACNHLRDLTTALCEARVVNGFDLRLIYENARQSHIAALSALKVPTEKFYANEQFGGTFTRFRSYRTQYFADITPDSIEAIKTIGTQDLAALIKSAAPPQLLDAHGSSVDVLPGAKTLYFGGTAFDDTVKDAEFQSRFFKLLELLAPGKTQTLVVYGGSRNLWFSVNAAVRAQKSGYSDVYWYRGGLESWKAAGLPTAKIVVQAVAN
jgi:Rhodanese-like domain